MPTSTIDLPAMYGDHHVIAVRQLLQALPGVTEVYASSAFRVVEVAYDEQLTGEEAIRSRLQEAGYGDELPVPEEREGGGTENGKKWFRHTAAFAQTGRAVAFKQHVPVTARPLWPCPGMGAVNFTKEGESNGPQT